MGFASAAGPHGSFDFKELRASYPLQLLVRFDRARQSLIYEAFEFEPESVASFADKLAAGIPPVSIEELRQIEGLLKRTKHQCSRMDDYMSRHMSRGVVKGQDASLPEYDQDVPFLLKCSAYGPEALHRLASWIRFRKSIQRRVRFPVAAITGIRLVTFDVARPHADLPAAKGDLDYSLLGTPSDEAEAENTRVAVVAELGDGTEIGPLSMLVIETASNGANIGASFAATQLLPVSVIKRKRVTCGDWTGSFSSSTRHYLIGDQIEMEELLMYLAHVSPHLASLLHVRAADR
jgi:hypothetical protein